MFSYKAHGLIIQTPLPFPELEEYNVSNHIDHSVSILWGEIDSSSRKILSEGTFRIASRYKLTPDSVYIIWNDIEICEVLNGKTIVVKPHSGLEDSFLRALILGPALGILLHQRGRLVLHASAVSIKDGVVAFMGHNGQGKSTTIAALNHEGYPFVTDDILSIKFDEKGVPLVLPGFPRIKLWSDTLQIFDEDPDKYPLISSLAEKRSYSIKGNLSTEPLPLKSVYVIENKDHMDIQPLSPQDSLIELLKNSYCANIFQNKDQTDNLKKYANIVNRVPIKNLNTKRSLQELPELIEMIINDNK